MILQPISANGGGSSDFDPSAGCVDIGGVLIQWGKLTANGDVTFVKSYASEPSVVTGTSRASTGVVSNVTKTGFKASSVVDTGFWWLAIGPA